MTDNQRYFLAVAEELNISKAAARLFISQQCLSKHIQRIEEAYHAKLFERRPKMRLTPAGEAVKEALYQIQVIEAGLADEIGEMNKDLHGSISLGIVRARTPILIPDIITKYNRIYPSVRIVLSNDYNANLEKQVANGRQDMCIGVEGAPNNSLRYVPLSEENIFLVISDELLQACFPKDYAQRVRDSLNGADLSRFQNVPFVLNTDEERLFWYIDDLARSCDTKLNVLFRSNDPITRMRLCLSNACASFFPEMTLQNVVDNLPKDEEKNLHYFLLPQHCTKFQLVLAYRRNAFLPEYRKEFIRIASEVVRQHMYTIKPR